MDEPRWRKFSQLKRDVFLEKLREGHGIGQAAAAVGVDRNTPRNYTKDYPDFARAIEEAQLDACEPVEAALYQQCLKGNMTAIIFYLLNRHSTRWQDRRNSPAQQQADLNEEQLKELLKQRGLTEL